MRYLGNKEGILQDITNLLNQKNLMNKQLTFFDAFAGTGAVSVALKNNFNIKINDSLSWSVIYTKGRLLSQNSNFKKLGVDPFDYFNSNENTRKDFFYREYSPGASNRMYFSVENAGKIDWIRYTIEQWKVNDLLDYGEYEYLLASLIESISKVANTAGVYGAYLKKWDPRALKKMEFIPVPRNEDGNPINISENNFFNDKLENIIGQVETDILYLDPPYTQNQYGTQYHLLETLIKMDNPSISPITGSRPTGPMRSDWSKEFKVNILLDKILSETTARYVLMSYSDDGIMSQSFIEAAFKRYGKAETYEVRKIDYKKYNNYKSKKRASHHEYLFFVELKNKDSIIYESPLNYTGSKSGMVDTIYSKVPGNPKYFFDIFGGGFNVGINSTSNNIYYNDNNYIVSELIAMFRDQDTYSLIKYIKSQINKFELTAANSENYKIVRDYYNNQYKKDPRLLFTLIMYGFQQQIRFNSKLEFNNPVGMRWFNDKILEKLVSFSRVIKEIDLTITACDFNEVVIPDGPETFIYLDPPYRLTLASYNDGKRGFSAWNIESEKKLLAFMEKRNAAGNKIMMSYILEHGELQNDNLKNWLTNNNHFHYINVAGTKGRNRSEILVLNYDE